MAKILIVEDEIELAEKIQEFLIHQEYIVDIVHTGADAIQILNGFSYDLIILDWELGDTFGAGCMQALPRQRWLISDNFS